jgi:hypothetical protein
MAVVNTPQACAEIYWPFMRCDKGFVSTFCQSLALDQDTGYPRVAYAQSHDGGGYDIVFRWWDGDEWQPTSEAVVVGQVGVDDGSVGRWLHDISLALDADGEPGIAYAYSLTVEEGGEAVKYMYADYTYPSGSWSSSSSWTPTTVLEDIEQWPWAGQKRGSSVSCAFKGDGGGDDLADGEPAIAFAVSEIDPQLRDAYIRNLVYYGEYDETEQQWSSSLIDWTGFDSSVLSPTEGSISLAMDLSQTQTTYCPRIAYDVIWTGQNADHEITYAWRDSSGWGYDTGGSKVDLGRYVSLALDPTDDYAPGIAFRKASDLDLWYTEKSGSSWTAEEVQEGVGSIRYPSLAMDANTGIPTVAWSLDGSSTGYSVSAKVREGTNDWEKIGGVSYESSSPNLAPSLALHPDSGRPFVAAVSFQEVFEYPTDVSPSSEHWMGVAYLPSFTVENGSGDVVASLGCFGDLVFGSLSRGTISPDPYNSEFIVKNPSGTDPEYLARISKSGNLKIKGSHYQRQKNITTSSSDGEFIAENQDGEVVCLIDESGNLELMGNLESTTF